MPHLNKRLAVFLILATFPCLAVADDWPQWRGANRDGVWNETGIIDRFESDQIEIRWRQPIGPGYSGPTVSDGRVFVTDRQSRPEQVERVHCFDAREGTSLWTLTYPCEYSISYEAGPRAAVTVDGQRAFALGAMGHFHCLDVASGKVLWKRDLDQEYSISKDGRMPYWGIAAAPLIYEGLVIVHLGGEDEASIVAFDKTNGEPVWKALSDRAQYSAPILIEQAGKTVMVCWTGDSVAGLDPANGDVFWRHVLTPSRMPIGIATPIVRGDRLFVTSFYDGSLMLRLRQDKVDVEQLWRRVGESEQQTDALQSIISTPVFLGDHIYGADSYGELRCLKAENGDRVWEDLTATPKARWSNLHFVQNGERTWMFNERGELIIGKLSPQGFEEISRAKLIEPTKYQLNRRGGVCWSHPAFANRHVYVRNDREIVCANLEAQ